MIVRLTQLKQTAAMGTILIWMAFPRHTLLQATLGLQNASATLETVMAPWSAVLLPLTFMNDCGEILIVSTIKQTRVGHLY